MTAPLSLQELLTAADLLGYLDALRNVLKLRHAGDIGDTDQNDLDGIGMSRPEQRRLWREYAKHFPMAEAKNGGHHHPQHRGGFVLKMLKRKVFGGGGGGRTEPAEEEGDRQDQKSDEGSRSGSDQCPREQQQSHRHIIPAERITLCKQIGSGEFGHVFQAAWHNGGVVAGDGEGEAVQQVAVKRILPEKLISQHSSFLQEAAIMTRMEHEHVVRLYGVVLDTKVVMLVSELAPCGSLLECLQCPSWREPFSVSTLAEFALQIGRGMQYLSSQRLIHRDLAARNVLVCTPTKVKISDFGLSRSLGHGEDYYRSEFSPTLKLPIAWCAPECINFLRFTSASDVWAYGVCLWEMFSYGKTPWEGLTGSQILHSIDTQRKKLQCPELCPRELYSALMLRCWEWEPERRCTFEQICEKMPALMPPLLVTVAENGDGGGGERQTQGQLNYGRDETIVLLDKSPPESPGLWLGVSKLGKVGLFRPEDTIAYLGAENPSSSSNGDIPAQLPEITDEKKKMKKKKKEKDKKEGKEAKKESKGEAERERKKQVEISQPHGDLRHTCHVGADGRTFGLFNVDKREFAKALPPRISPRSPPPPESPTLSASPLLMMSTSMVSLTPPRPPKNRMAADVMSRSVCLGQQSPATAGCSASSTEYQNNSASHSSSPRHFPPTLPPKPPRFRPFYGPRPCSPSAPAGPTPPSTPQHSSPANSSGPPSCPSSSSSPSTHPLHPLHHQPPFPHNPIWDEVTPKTNDGCGAEDEGKEDIALISCCPDGEFDPDHLPQPINPASAEENRKIEEEEEEGEFLRPISICCEHPSPVAEGVKAGGRSGEEEEQRILHLLTELQQDLTNFSLNSLDDCSDRRALLDGEQRRTKELNQLEEQRKREKEAELQRHGVITASSSMIVGMDREELERRGEEERRKAKKRLKMRKDEGGGGGGGPEEEGGGRSNAGEKRTSVVSSIISTACHRLAGAEGREGKMARVNAEEEAEARKQRRSEQRNSVGLSSLPRSTKEPVAGWTPEAHEAYKLLVQCGHTLKDTALINSSAIEKIVSPKGGGQQQHLNGMQMVEQPKKLEYINTTLVGWKDGGGEAGGRSDLVESNRNVCSNGELVPRDGVGPTMASTLPKTAAAQSAGRVPPPVPPKPKIHTDLSNGHLYSSAGIH